MTKGFWGKMKALKDKLEKESENELNNSKKQQISNKITVIIGILVGIFTIKSYIPPVQIAGIEAYQYIIDMSGVSVLYIFLSALVLSDYVPKWFRLPLYKLSEVYYHLTISLWVIAGTLIMGKVDIGNFYKELNWVILLLFEGVILLLPFFKILVLVLDDIKKFFKYVLE